MISSKNFLLKFSDEFLEKVNPLTAEKKKISKEFVNILNYGTHQYWHTLKK